MAKYVPKPSVREYRPKPKPYSAELHYRGTVERISAPLPDIWQYAKTKAADGSLDILHIFTPNGTIRRTRDELAK